MQKPNTTADWSIRVNAFCRGPYGARIGLRFERAELTSGPAVRLHAVLVTVAVDSVLSEVELTIVCIPLFDVYHDRHEDGDRA